MPPRTHNLELLAEKTKISAKLSDEQKSFLRLMEPLNVESRYPADIDLLSKSLTAEKCRSIFKETGEMLAWIEKKY